MNFDTDILRAFCRSLTANGLSYIPDEDRGIIEWYSHSIERIGKLSCTFRKTSIGCNLMMHLPVKAEPEQMIPTARLIDRINEQTDIGHFLLNWDTGAVSLSVQMLLPAGANTDLLAVILKRSEETVNRFSGSLLDILCPDSEPDDYDNDTDDDYSFLGEDDDDSYDDSIYSDDDDDDEEDIYLDDDDDEDDTDPDQVIL